MASIITLPIELPAAPAGYSKPSKGKAVAKPVERQVYPAGPSYISYARRDICQLSFAQDDEATSSARAAAAAAKSAEAGAELYPGLGEEQETKEVLASDPKEYKKQDHYAILGLGHLRYKANDDQIKIARESCATEFLLMIDRRKVLRHHPDKKADHNDGFFKCIQKAHEALTNPEKRRQFDSIDWNIQDETPDPKKVPAEKYCEVWAPIFAREGRFSNVQPVAEFGDMDAPKDVVEGFYDFWYNFDSWRSFEWHDKEVNEGEDSRDQKRFTEKKNKSERQRLKKDDNTRLRELVDSVLANDPRIKRIKEEQKAARLAKKGGAAKPAAKKLSPAEIKKQAEEKRKAEEEAKKAEAAANQTSKADREAAKKAKEAARKNLKKWKKAIATVIASSNYFQAEGTAPSAAVIEKQLAELDAIAELSEPEQIKTLKEKVEAAGNGEGAKAALKEAVAALGEKGAGKFTEFA